MHKIEWQYWRITRELRDATTLITYERTNIISPKPGGERVTEVEEITEVEYNNHFNLFEE